VVGGLTTHLPVANFLRFIYAKKYENWLRVGKVIAKKAVCSFFGPPCTCTEESRVVRRVRRRYLLFCSRGTHNHYISWFKNETQKHTVSTKKVINIHMLTINRSFVSAVSDCLVLTDSLRSSTSLWGLSLHSCK